MHHRSARPFLLLVTLLAAGLLPSGVAAAEPGAPDPSPEVRPSVHYEDALAHAHDRIAFEPGGRVSVPFRPRATDTWPVGGQPPQALPAGRLTGRSMRDPGAANRFPIDLPTTRPSDIIATRGTVFDPTTDGPVFRTTAAVDPGGLKREVFGFLPYWELSDSSTRLDWAKISTVAYFGVGADSKGNLMRRTSDGTVTVGWSGWTSDRMTSVIDAAHRGQARVVLTVQSFGWSSSGLARQKALLKSPTARANLARQIAKAVRDRGADGVNLDFEPIASGYADEFTKLVRKVRAVLDDTAPGYQLTFDTTGWIGNYPVEAATKKGGADAIFVMGYDFRSPSSRTVGSLAPIGGPDYDVGDALRAYLERVPASKLILGVPYYGRAWSAASDKLGARNISGPKYGGSVSVSYVDARAAAIQYGKRYDPVQGVAWAAYKRKNCTDAYGCVKPWRQLYYDDSKAIKAKYDLVNRYDLRGAGIWALGYDGTRPELYQAIEDRFITDSVPPAISSSAVSATVFSPNGDGIADTTTASMKVTGLLTWGVSVRRLDGTTLGKTIRSGRRTGKAPTFTWDGKDQDGHRVKDGRYRITLWSADISNNRSSRSFDVTVDTRKSRVTSAAGVGFVTPDADKHADTLPLSWSADEAITGIVRLRDASGTTIRSWRFSKDGAWHATWDGTAKSGATVRDGRYTFLVDGRDRVGNRTVTSRTILVDRTIRSVRWSAASFDPRAKATDRVAFVLRRSATVSVAIYRGSTLIRKVWTAKALKAGTHRWTWDGRTAAGKLVKPGAYRIQVTATSRIGLTHYSRGVTVLVH
jgi:spore germination protein YaaH/flagellar hook assembly protein FlgD